MFAGDSFSSGARTLRRRGEISLYSLTADRLLCYNPYHTDLVYYTGFCNSSQPYLRSGIFRPIMVIGFQLSVIGFYFQSAENEDDLFPLSPVMRRGSCAVRRILQSGRSDGDRPDCPHTCGRSLRFPAGTEPALSFFPDAPCGAFTARTGKYPTAMPAGSFPRRNWPTR